MFTSLLNLFFPKVCAGCNSFLLEDEAVICTMCRHEIPLTNFHLNPDNEAYHKFYGKAPVRHVVTFMYYHKKGIVQEMIHKLKYKGRTEIGTALGEWYAADLKQLFENDPIDEIIPVPLHRRRLRQRGYNQVASFGETLARRLDVGYNDQLLARVVYSKTQTTKNLFGRTEAKKELFDVTYSDSDHSKHLLLVDDVLTTGSTLESCCRALGKIPHIRISIVCMAMSHS